MGSRIESVGGIFNLISNEISGTLIGVIIPMEKMLKS